MADGSHERWPGCAYVARPRSRCTRRHAGAGRTGRCCWHRSVCHSNSKPLPLGRQQACRGARPWLAPSSRAIRRSQSRRSSLWYMKDRLIRGSACLGSVPPGSLAERTDGRRLEGASSWAQMSVHGGAQQGALPGNRLQRGRGAASDISGGLASRSVATSAERG